MEGLANLGLQGLGILVLNADDQQVQSLASFRPTAIDFKPKAIVGVLFQVRKSDFDLVALVLIQDQGGLEAPLQRIVAGLVEDGGELLKAVDIDAHQLGFLQTLVVGLIPQDATAKPEPAFLQGNRAAGLQIDLLGLGARPDRCQAVDRYPHWAIEVVDLQGRRVLNASFVDRFDAQGVDLRVEAKRNFRRQQV